MGRGKQGMKILSKRKIILRFREENRDIFDAIKDGRKKIETRAATKKYQKIKAGDVLVFVCGKDRFEKPIWSVRFFKTISAMLKKYRVRQINPNVKNEKELVKMYYDFPKYKEKIKKFGLAV